MGFLNDIGMFLFPWQELAIRDSLLVSDGYWAARTFGMVVARQNGKSEFAVARILIGLFMIGEPLIIYCAHEAATAKEIFLRIKGILEDDSLDDHFTSSIQHVWQGNGNFGIEMTSGARVLFKTRTKGTARGFSCDCLILDEGMFLSHTFAQSVLPSQMARKNPQTFVMGSAAVGSESEYFGLVRRNAMSHDPEDYEGLTWMEWCADLCTDYCDIPEGERNCTDHDDPLDEEVWKKTNPSYGVTINARDMRTAWKNLDEKAFYIENLSVGDWPQDLDEFGVIKKEAWEWADCDKQQLGLEQHGRVVFAVSLAQDMREAVITVAGYTDDTKTDILAEIVDTDTGLDMKSGTQWLVPELRRLCAKGKPYAIIIDAKGQGATNLIEAIKRDKGIKCKVISPSPHDYAQSCADYAVGVSGTKNEPRTIYHYGQVELTKAVAGADKRKLSGLWAWSRANDSCNILPLEAVTLAVWGLKKAARESNLNGLWFIGPGTPRREVTVDGETPADAASAVS